MKKLLTTLALITALGLSVFAQETTSAPAGTDCKEGFGPGQGMRMEMGQNKCGEMGNMHKGMKGMDKECGMGMGMDNDNDKCHFGPMMFEKLDLTKEQMDKIHQIKIKNEKLDIDSKAELKKLKIDKMEAMRSMNFDKAKEVIKKMSEIKTKSQIGNIDEMVEITKLLTKEQLDKMKDMHGNPGMMKHKMKK